MTVSLFLMSSFKLDRPPYNIICEDLKHEFPNAYFNIIEDKRIYIFDAAFQKMSGKHKKEIGLDPCSSISLKFLRIKNQ